MATFLIAHGAWGGGWSWGRLRAPLRDAGHVLFTPTYAGLGDRSHLANPSIDLETHIGDIAAVFTFEDLRDVTLVGHSYGGMVATGVADRVPDRIARIVYLDAFVPRDGESVLDIHGPESAAQIRERARVAGGGWAIPPSPLAPDVSAADSEWLTPRRKPQPLRTFEQKINLSGNRPDLPRSYIYCTRKDPGDVFARFAAEARRGGDGWRYLEIDSGHTPNVTAPSAVAAILGEIISK
jgi:pimeloyl-ACP methyl ester carboxylesterase